MNRKMFILNSQTGSAGVARLKESDGKTELTLQLKSDFGKNCVPILICDSGEVIPFKKTKNKMYYNVCKKDEITGIVLKNRDNAVAWSGETPPAADIGISSSEKNEEQLLTFDNFFGGEFSWQRIRGNFVVHNYSIIHHILGQKKVYPLINQTGYYCAGFKEKDDMTLIALALPVVKNSQNPFQDLNTETYIIHSEKKDYYAICVGIDKTGEFFLTY